MFLLLSPVSPLYYKGTVQIPYPTISHYNINQQRKQGRYSDFVGVILYGCAVQWYWSLTASVVFYSPPKLAKQISLGISQISLRSNRTRQRRIKLRGLLMRSWATRRFFVVLPIGKSSRVNLGHFWKHLAKCAGLWYNAIKNGKSNTRQKCLGAIDQYNLMRHTPPSRWGFSLSLIHVQVFYFFWTPWKNCRFVV